MRLVKKYGDGSESERKLKMLEGPDVGEKYVENDDQSPQVQKADILVETPQQPHLAVVKEE